MYLAWWQYRANMQPPEGQQYQSYLDWWIEWGVEKPAKDNPQQTKVDNIQAEIARAYRNTQWFHGGYDEPGINNYNERFGLIAQYQKGTMK